MRARIGSTDAEALLRALGADVRGWGEGNALAVYVESPDHMWRLAREIGGILPTPRWDHCGPWWIAYWPEYGYAGEDS